MPKLINLQSKRFGHLMVKGQSGRSKHGEVIWECQCDCGKTTKVLSRNLTKGATKSCGCQIKLGVVRHGYAAKKGTRPTPTYSTWQAMKQRCSNKNNRDYHHYGGRGIKVCKHWMLFENFLADMGEKPSSIHSIDRIDNNGDYEPGNCRWATPKEQRHNQRPRKVV